MQHEINETASRIRKVLEKNRDNTSDINFTDFPRGACGVTSELLGRYFRDFMNMEAYYVEASRDDDCTHAWVTIENLIIDITADQFDQEPVIVSYNSPWHDQWETKPPSSICYPENWPMYPFNTWNTIIQAMQHNPA